ncbi:ferredoxin [Mollisia scopiformis]|uniref:Ferredoxin n=1 Tax=Mollisia scopiformis TaxID=149040 RepID=A0A194XBM9_MOLSC|nr:ferredoxin [Mollisia scopiformis]KUJ17563.1 ferredoxin [Mollisia scopiformis]
MPTTRTLIRGLSSLGRPGGRSRHEICARTSISQARSFFSTCNLNPASRISSHTCSQTNGRFAGGSVTNHARRSFSASSISSHGHWEPPKDGEEIYVTFIDKDGDEHKIAVNKGDNLLTIAQGNDIEMEGKYTGCILRGEVNKQPGACEGSCSCSTCHVIVEDETMYDKIPEATDDENDMLDLAFGLTETSRLGCQIEMTKELDGLRVKLPSMTRNLQASDFSKKS